MLATGPRVAEVDEEERRHEDPGQQVERPVDAVAARVVVVALRDARGSRRVATRVRRGYRRAGDAVTRRARSAPRSSSRLGGLGREGRARGARGSPRAASSSSSRSAPSRAQAGRVAAQLEDARFDARRGRCRAPSPGRPSSSGARGAMKAIARGRIAGVGLRRGGCRRRGPGSGRSTWWRANMAGVDRVAAEDRAEREGGAVALGRAPGRGRWRSARRRAGRSSARPGWRRACRASRRRGRGRSSRSPAGAARAAPVIASGSAITRLGADQAATRSSAPAGSRWIPVISAPESVVGIAATSAPVTEAIALAVSITRPPPKATRRLDAGRVEQRRGGVGHLARRDLVHGCRPPRQSSGAARGRARSSAARRRSKPCSASSSGASPQPRCRRKTTTRAGVAPDEAAGHPAATVRGLTTGRRFGSTSARRCSKSGGSESFSPRCSSGSSTVKPGPERGDLEEDAARLAEVDRAEVEAVDHRGRLGAARRSPARATPRARRSSRPRRCGGRCRRPAAARSAGGSS